MDRSLAGRSPIALPLPRLGGVAGTIRGLRGLVASSRRARIALVAALAATPLLIGGWLWLRQSPFVSVQHVRITGVHGPETRAIEAALTDAARHMSTLDINAGALRRATSQFVVVREVRAVPRFPHGLRIHVIEQLPVAALVVGGVRTAVAADGVVLGPDLLSSSFPTVVGFHEALVGKRVNGPNVLAAVTVLGAAPAPLRHVVARVYTGPDGLTVAFRGGLLAYFGDATLPHAKWLSLARVLADSSSAGTSYVDVRLPGRPAAGFPAGVTPPASTTATGGASETPAMGESASASEATVSSIAASLAGSAGGSAASTTSATETPSTTAETAREAPSASTAETSESSETSGG